jgi:lipoprotein-releasing system permease protein
VRTWLPFEWIAALRFLAEGRMQAFFIVVGAAIGVAVIVFMAALLAGLQGNTIRRSLSAQAHIVVQPADDASRPQPRTGAISAAVQKRTQRVASIDQWRKVRHEVRSIAGVEVASAIASGGAFAVRGEANRSISVIGIEPDEYARIVPLPEKLVAGTFRLGSGDALIGTELGLRLGLGVGDKLRLATAGGGDATVNVTGVFDLGSRGVNERNVYVPLRTAQDLLGLPGGVSAIDVTVSDVWQAEAVAQRIAANVGLRADSWIATNQQFFVALKAQTVANIALRVAVGFSVALGIASVLVVSVVQRSREIGILRAMGASRAQVMRVFLIQGALVAFVGSLAGVAIAGAALHAWSLMLRNPDGTPLFSAPMEAPLVAWAVVIATVTGLVAATAPARRAARLDPVQAIRG